MLRFLQVPQRIRHDVGITSQCYFTSEPGHILSTLWLKTLTEYSDKTHAYASCKTSLFFDTLRLTVIDFFGEFCELLLNNCIKKPYYGYNGGQ